MQTFDPPLFESLEPRRLLNGSLEAFILDPPTGADEGAAIELEGGAYNAVPGDTISYLWSVTRNGELPPYASGEDQTFQFTPDDDGSYVVTLEASGAESGTDTATAPISVLNVAPVIDLPGGGGGGTTPMEPNGNFEDGLTGWGHYGGGLIEVVDGQLHLKVTNILVDYSETTGLWSFDPASELGVSLVNFMSPDAGGKYAPDGTTGLQFEATVTVQVVEEPLRPAGDMLRTLINYSGYGAWLDLPVAEPSPYTIALDGLDNTLPIEVQLYTMPSLDLGAPAVGNTSYTVELEAWLDNFAWVGGEGPTAVDEGTPIVLLGDATDPGTADTLTYTWSVDKDGDPYASGSDEDFTFTPDDDGTYVVTVAVQDDDGGVGGDTATYGARNVAPTVTVAGPEGGVAARGEAAEFTLTADDASPIDLAGDFTYQITWGDGDVETVVGPAGLVVSHPYGDLGPQTVSVVATDKDGGASDPAVAAVEVFGGELTGGDLLVSGTATGNRVDVVSNGGIEVRIDEDGDGIADWIETYDAGVVTSIVLYGLGGDDVIVVDEGITLPVELYGGAGNDSLTGGGGNDVLDGGDGDDTLVGAAGDDVAFGGAGIDHLTGSSGNDILVGGDGADRLVGSSGHDILVACEVNPAYTVADLRAILADWVDAHTVEGTTEEEDPDDGTVFDDDIDTLTGGSGSDLFVIGEGDRITDFKNNKKQHDETTDSI